MSTITTDPKPTTPPTWDEYWLTVGNENYLYARELIELSVDVCNHFAGFISWRDEPCLVDDPDDPPYSMADPTGRVRREADLDWSAAARSADSWAASSTQLRLLALVLSLVNPDETEVTETRTFAEGDFEVRVTKGTRMVDVRDLGSMGSWRDDVARILFRYISGQPPVGARS